MKIFHLVLDGYHPDNEVDFFDNFGMTVNNRTVRTFSTTYEDEKMLNSSIQWPKIYTGQSLENIARWDANNPVTMSIRDKFKTLKEENFLWNVLAKQGCSSLIFPYGSLASIFHDNLLSRQSEDYCTMMVRRWGRPSYFLQLGKLKDKIQSDYLYWGLHEVGDTMDLKLSLETKEKLRDYWKTGSSESLGNLAVDLEDFYIQSYKEKLDENLKVIKKEFAQFINGQNYVHLGLIETDTMYHYASIYSKARQLIRDYVLETMRIIKKKYNPDCILVHGDHNMVPISEEIQDVFPDKKLTSVNYKGAEYKCIKSRTGYSPIYHEHGNKVGGIMWARDKKVLDIFGSFLKESDFITAVRAFVLTASQIQLSELS